MIKHSQFKWKEYLEYNRPDININTFMSWCIYHRPKKSVFDIEQELLETLQLYDNRKYSKFRWRQYIQENRPDISIDSFRSWCIKTKPKKSLFDTEQELLQAISLYDKKSVFKWRQYLKENRPDINIEIFRTWCTRHRPKKSVFNTKQELLETILLYDNRQKLSKFNLQQYLKENRPDIDIVKFRNWCNYNRQKKQIFDTEQELLQAICVYDLNKIYIIRKTKYDNVYNLIEKETGLKFNFYRIEDMMGLL